MDRWICFEVANFEILRCLLLIFIFIDLIQSPHPNFDFILARLIFEYHNFLLPLTLQIAILDLKLAFILQKYPDSAIDGFLEPQPPVLICLHPLCHPAVKWRDFELCFIFTELLIKVGLKGFMGPSVFNLIFIAYFEFQKRPLILHDLQRLGQNVEMNV